MQPYGLELQSDKGLFTFYREQQEAQNGLKSKISADHLQKILGKAKRVNMTEKKKTYPEKIKEKSLISQTKAKDTFIPQSSSTAKRQQLRLKKSIIEQPKHIEPEFQNDLKLEGNYSKNYAHTANTSIHHQSSIHDEQSNNKESLKKYMSDFDTLRLKRKAIFQESPSSQNQKQHKKSLSPQNKKKQLPDEKIVQISKSKLILHFKKMALEPQEFSGLNEVDKNFAPISVHKKQKSGLKSYRKEKLKLSLQKKGQDFQQKNKTDKPKQKYSVFDKQAIKNTTLPLNSVKEQNVKLIRVQKISKKTQNNSELDKTLIEQTKSGDPLTKLSLNLPQISSRHRDQSNRNSMSLELMKSHELKSKYQMRELEKEDESIVSANQKLRNQLRYLKNSPKKINHHISLNLSPDVGLIQSERQMSSIPNAEKSPNNSIELLKAQQLSFKKQKLIFCKRDQYLRGYSKKVKRNKFLLEKQDEIKIRSLMEERKRQIVENLMEKLTFI